MSTPVIPADTASIYDGLRTLVLDNQTLALLTPATPPPGIGGFLFDLPQEDNFKLTATATEHYVEDLSAVQDHVALAPERIVLRGLVAELVLTPETVNNSAPEAKKGTTTAPGMTPPGTSTPTAAPGTAKATAQNSLPTLYSKYQSAMPQQPKQTRQSMVFGYFYQLWKGRTLCTVETPWGIMRDMLLESLDATQGESTRWASEFSATFVRIRTAGTISKARGEIAGRFVLSLLNSTNNGYLTGTDSVYSPYIFKPKSP